MRLALFLFVAQPTSKKSARHLQAPPPPKVCGLQPNKKKGRDLRFFPHSTYPFLEGLALPCRRPQCFACSHSHDGEVGRKLTTGKLLLPLPPAPQPTHGPVLGLQGPQNLGPSPEPPLRWMRMALTTNGSNPEWCAHVRQHWAALPDPDRCVALCRGLSVLVRVHRQEVAASEQREWDDISGPGLDERDHLLSWFNRRRGMEDAEGQERTLIAAEEDAIFQVPVGLRRLGWALRASSAVLPQPPPLRKHGLVPARDSL